MTVVSCVIMEQESLLRLKAMIPVPDCTISSRPWESKRIPRGVERFVAMMSHANPGAGTGDVFAFTDDEQS